MASKGGVLAVSAIVGVGALLAFAASAKADTPKGGGDGQTPDERNLCAAHKAERATRMNTISQLKGALVDIDAARIEVEMNGGDSTALDQQRANVVAQLNIHQNRVNQLDGLIEACE